MVTHQESDEIEQITKSSHCRANFYLFILFSEEKIAYVIHILTIKFMLILQKSERTSFKTMFDFGLLKGKRVPIFFFKLQILIRFTLFDNQ